MNSVIRKQKECLSQGVFVTLNIQGVKDNLSLNQNNSKCITEKSLFDLITSKCMIFIYRMWSERKKERKKKLRVNIQRHAGNILSRSHHNKYQPYKEYKPATNVGS